MMAEPYSWRVRHLFDNTMHAGSVAGAASAAKNEQGVRLELSGSASDGVVTLQGPAADAQQADLARLIAVNTCGVKRVNSNLQIPAQP